MRDISSRTRNGVGHSEKKDGRLLVMPEPAAIAQVASAALFNNSPLSVRREGLTVLACAHFFIRASRFVHKSKPIVNILTVKKFFRNDHTIFYGYTDSQE